MKNIKSSKSTSIKTQAKFVFIDTCVIQDIGSNDKSKSEAVINFFEQLEKDGYGLVISEFTIYENLQGLLGKRSEKAGSILDGYESYLVSRDVLKFASILQGLYHDEKYENISDGDKIIAATCILENGYVLTRNHKDFPHPFFITERSVPLIYFKNHYQLTLDLALYKPDIGLIKRRINEKNKL